MSTILRFYPTDTVTHDCLRTLEAFLDGNHEHIPYKIHESLVEIFNELNEEIGKLVAEIEELKEEN